MIQSSRATEIHQQTCKKVTNTFHTTVLKDISLAVPKDEALTTGQGRQTEIEHVKWCVFFDQVCCFLNKIGKRSTEDVQQTTVLEGVCTQLQYLIAHLNRFACQAGRLLKTTRLQQKSVQKSITWNTEQKCGIWDVVITKYIYIYMDDVTKTISLLKSSRTVLTQLR